MSTGNNYETTAMIFPIWRGFLNIKLKKCFAVKELLRNSSKPKQTKKTNKNVEKTTTKSI